MQNSKTIPAGATVYYARRNLDYFYTRLMRVSTAKVVKRTPLGYKFESEYGNGFHKDEEYYISEDKKEIAALLLEDIKKGEAQLAAYAAEIAAAKEILQNV